MATKSWKQLSEVLSEVLSQTLKKGEVSSVMEAWNERKGDVTKLVGSTSSRGGKKKKDPNAPKHWQSSYLLFCRDNREKVKRENEGITNLEIISKLAEMWKAVSEKEKKKYTDMAVKDRARYDKEMESYTPPSDDESEEKPKKTKKVREGPKRPLTSYMYFCQDVRKDVEKETGFKGKEVMSELGRRWKLLSDDEKVPYVEKYQTDQQRYEDEKSSGEGTTSDAPAKTSKSKAKKSAKEEAPVAKPSKAKKSAKEEAPVAKKGAKAPKEEAPVAETKKGKKSAKEEAPVAETKKGKKSAKEEAPVAPAKRAEASKSKKTPGFECFSEEQQDEIAQENPDWTSKKVSAEVSKRWSELTDEDREAYEMEAAGGSGDEDAVELEEEDD